MRLPGECWGAEEEVLPLCHLWSSSCSGVSWMLEAEAGKKVLPLWTALYTGSGLRQERCPIEAKKDSS